MHYYYSLDTHSSQPSTGKVQSIPSTHTTSTVERLRSARILLPVSLQPKSKEPPLGITVPAVKLSAARPEDAGGVGGVGQPFT